MSFSLSPYGLPKGVMLTHDNVCGNALTAVGRVPLEGLEGDLRVLSFLPVCHIFERIEVEIVESKSKCEIVCVTKTIKMNTKFTWLLH